MYSSDGDVFQEHKVQGELGQTSSRQFKISECIKTYLLNLSPSKADNNGPAFPGNTFQAV